MTIFFHIKSKVTIKENKKTMKILFKIVLLLSFTACASEKRIEEIIRSQGLHPISVNNCGCQFSGCGEKDAWKASFTAYTADSSKIISGCACAERFSGYVLKY